MYNSFTHLIIIGSLIALILLFRINKLSITSTRRLSIGLIASAGSLLFSAFNLFGVGVSSGNKVFAAKIATSIIPLVFSVAFGFLSLIFAELADHPNIPTKGHPRSKINYLESAFVYLAILGLSGLIYGAYLLVVVVTS